MLRVPAVQALLIQCLSLAIVLPLIIAVSSFTDFKIPIIAAVLIQGACGAGLSRLFRLAPWWLPIQFILPPALLMGTMLHLPSGIYLLAFLLLLALYWTTFRSQVPFYPSGPLVWKTVAGLLPQSHPIRFIDIGSGMGGLVLYLARQRTECTFIGIEVAPLPWVISRVRAVFTRSPGTFLRGDYNLVDFGNFDVVFAYLSPAAMPALWSKARSEMRPGALLLSYEFAILETQPQIIELSTSDGPILYGWNM
ncbi:MAG: SAM-dependent methyltransferase [Burkholderiales bacterium]